MRGYGQSSKATIRADEKITQARWAHGVVGPIDVNYETGSCDDLDLPDGSVDYVFCDPPFGSNIFYADCNLIWESWLGTLTNTDDEAVVNRSLAVENGGVGMLPMNNLVGKALVSYYSTTGSAVMFKPWTWPGAARFERIGEGF